MYPATASTAKRGKRNEGWQGIERMRNEIQERKIDTEERKKKDEK